MKKRRSLQTVLAFLCAILLLASGCGSGSKSAVSYDMAAAETMAAASMEAVEMEAVEMATEEAMAGGGGFYGYTASQSPAAMDGGEAGATTSDSSAAKSPNNLPANRKLIRTVNMHLETDEFDTLLTGIQKRIAALGGYIEHSDVSGQRTNHRNEPIPRYAELTVRIPSTELDSFTAAVEEGANVTNRSENTTDVTLQYSDIESRKKSLTIEQERIWALLEKADSLEAVIALEQRLSEIRYELESMESQLRLYDNQVDYSTVHLFINEVTIYTPTAPETIGQRIQNGFARSLENVADFCVELFIGIVASSPVWVPLAILIAIAVILLRRRSGKRAAKRISAIAMKARVVEKGDENT